MKRMKIDTIMERLILALEILYKKDAFLIKNDVDECSVTHKLADYLQMLIPKYNVDCEYNRVGVSGDPKRDAEGGIIRPDIIIHTRGIQKNNRCVIEVKKETNNDKEGYEKDLKNIEFFGNVAKSGMLVESLYLTQRIKRVRRLRRV